MPALGALMIRKGDAWEAVDCGGDIPAMREEYKSRVRAGGKGIDEIVLTEGVAKRRKFHARKASVADSSKKNRKK